MKFTCIVCDFTFEPLPSAIASGKFGSGTVSAVCPICQNFTIKEKDENTGGNYECESGNCKLY